MNRRVSGYESEPLVSQDAGTIELPQKAEGANPRSSAVVEPKDQSRPNQDPVEAALADALTRASAAGQWDVVGTLARELQARRQARTDVIDLEAARRRRET